jgi:anti-anti-sigma regulatory factor
MELCSILHCDAALAPGAAVKTVSILSFPCAGDSASRRALRKDLLSALRVSQSPVIVDFSGCRTLDHEDIDLLLECVAQVAGRDTQVQFVAGSRVIRVLLEVTRISSLVPVFDSMDEALADPKVAAENNGEPANFKKRSA